MPGPPPTPNVIKLMRGNPWRRPVRSEPQPTIPETMPPPPPFLAPYAQDEWWTTGPELHQLGLLTVLDIMPFAAYCQSYAMWRVAMETLNKMAEKDAVTSGLLVKSSQGGDPMPNPIAATARQAANDMIRHAGHFGLSPAARARIASAGFEPPSGPSKFDGLIA
jgi:P27 family predicted phage terminase small subunit